jgi:hypothetical protein
MRKILLQLLSWLAFCGMLACIGWFAYECWDLFTEEYEAEAGDPEGEAILYRIGGVLFLAVVLLIPAFICFLIWVGLVPAAADLAKAGGVRDFFQSKFRS